MTEREQILTTVRLSDIPIYDGGSIPTRRLFIEVDKDDEITRDEFRAFLGHCQEVRELEIGGSTCMLIDLNELLEALGDVPSVQLTTLSISTVREIISLRALSNALHSSSQQLIALRLPSTAFAVEDCRRILSTLPNITQFEFLGERFEGLGGIVQFLSVAPSLCNLTIYFCPTTHDGSFYSKCAQVGQHLRSLTLHGNYGRHGLELLCGFAVHMPWLDRITIDSNFVLDNRSGTLFAIDFNGGISKVMEELLGNLQHSLSVIILSHNLYSVEVLRIIMQRFHSSLTKLVFNGMARRVIPEEERARFEQQCPRAVLIAED